MPLSFSIRDARGNGSINMIPSTCAPRSSLSACSRSSLRFSAIASDCSFVGSARRVSTAKTARCPRYAISISPSGLSITTPREFFSGGWESEASTSSPNARKRSALTLGPSASVTGRTAENLDGLADFFCCSESCDIFPSKRVGLMWPQRGCPNLSCAAHSL